MSLNQHHQRAQFHRQQAEDARIKEAYAETLRREAAWVAYINKGKAK
jgi:hypothetical protein